MDLLVRKQIGRLILIHAMTIHDMQAFLYLCSIHNNNILHCNPLFFYIWHVCVMLRFPVCGAVYFHFPQNGNAPTMRLNTPHFQNSTPMSTQIDANAFCYLNNVAQDVKMITASR